MVMALLAMMLRQMPIKSIPLVLHGNNYPDDFEIRGEIIMPRNVFEELNRERDEEGEPAICQPRNAASGTLKQLSSAVVAKRKLDCFLYYILGDNLPFNNHYQNFLMAAKQWGFKILEHVTLCHDLSQVIAYIHH